MPQLKQSPNRPPTLQISALMLRIDHLVAEGLFGQDKPPADTQTPTVAPPMKTVGIASEISSGQKLT
jgi:hypothetical protein